MINIRLLPDKNSLYLLLSLLLMLLILLSDSLTQLGFAHGILYSPVLLLAARAHRLTQLDWAFAIGLLFIWLGFKVAPSAGSDPLDIYILGNRILSSLALLAVYLLCRSSIIDRRNQLRREQQLQQATQLARLGYWQLDGKKQQLQLDHQARTFTNSATQITQRQFIDCFNPLDQPRLSALLQSCLRQQQPVDSEFMLGELDINHKWVRLLAQPDPEHPETVHGVIMDISSMRSAEQQANERQSQLRYLADNFPLFVWTARPDGSLDYASQEVSRLTGLDSNYIVNNWLSLLKPEDQEPTMQRWMHCLKTGTPYTTEFRLRRHDGRYIWHLVKATALHDGEGKIIKWYGSAMDIDELKSLSEHSEQLRQQLHNTLHSITDAFFTLNQQMQFSYVNQQAAQILAAGQSLEGRLWQDCLPDDTLFSDAFRRALRQQMQVAFEGFFAPARLWLDVRIYPAAEGLTVYFRDVTRQRAQQQELQLLRSAVAQLNDIVMITDVSAKDSEGPRIVFVNEAFERITGFSRDEVLGTSPKQLLGPKTETAQLEKIRAALRRWQPVRARVTHHTKQQQEVILELNIVPISNQQGEFTHWVSVERDVTEETALQQQLFQAQRMEAFGQLTGGIAHDFNNLLTVIRGNADLLSEQLAGQPALLPLLQLITDATERGAGLTHNLLAFARRQPLSPSIIDIRERVEGLVNLLRSSLGSKIQLNLHLQAQLWPVMVDPVQLESSLLNLALNARDAMPAGGILEISAENISIGSPAPGGNSLPAGDYVCLTIRDNGCGIAKEHLDKIFEPFFTTKAIGQGTGLGLSMAFGFIKQSGGHVSVDSEPDKGSRFRLYLPRTTATRPVVNRPAQTNANSAGQTILLVEDDAMVRQSVIQALNNAGYQLWIATNAQQALDGLQTGQTIDLLFSDIRMPGGISGIQLAHQARQLRPQLPVLLTTGFSDTPLDQLAEFGSGYALLNKPYSNKVLLEQVELLLNQTTKKS